MNQKHSNIESRPSSVIYLHLQGMNNIDICIINIINIDGVPFKVHMKRVNEQKFVEPLKIY